MKYESIEKGRKFTQSEDLKKRMEQVGTIDMPELFYPLNLYDNKTIIPLMLEKFKSSQPDLETKLSPEKVKAAATELMNLFKNKFENSVFNESGKAIIATEYVFLSNFQSGWSVDLSQKDKVEIQRKTEKIWYGNIIEQENLETVTIITGKAPSVSYKFKSKEDTSQEPQPKRGQFENTPFAVDKSKEIIAAIPQIVKKQRSPHKCFSGIQIPKRN